MPKLIKFKGQRSQDRIRHILIFDDEQNVHFTFCEKRPIMQPAGFFTGCLRATGLDKTPGELGAASLTHRLLKLSRRP